MIRLLNALQLLTTALLGFSLGSLYGQAVGGSVEREVAELREQSISAQHAAAFAVENERHRATEAALRADVDAAMQSFSRTIANEKAQHDRLVADLRGRTVRLSVPIVASSATCAADASRDPSAPLRVGNEARAELAPAAATDLDAIATDGNTAIIQLNAVIDRYNGLRERLNGLSRHAEAQ